MRSSRPDQRRRRALDGLPLLVSFLALAFAAPLAGQGRADVIDVSKFPLVRWSFVHEGTVPAGGEPRLGERPAPQGWAPPVEAPHVTSQPLDRALEEGRTDGLAGLPRLLLVMNSRQKVERRPRNAGTVDRSETELGPLRNGIASHFAKLHPRRRGVTVAIVDASSTPLAHGWRSFEDVASDLGRTTFAEEGKGLYEFLVAARPPSQLVDGGAPDRIVIFVEAPDLASFLDLDDEKVGRIRTWAAPAPVHVIVAGARAFQDAAGNGRVAILDNLVQKAGMAFDDVRTEAAETAEAAAAGAMVRMDRKLIEPFAGRHLVTVEFRSGDLDPSHNRRRVELEYASGGATIKRSADHDVPSGAILQAAEKEPERFRAFVDACLDEELRGPGSPATGLRGVLTSRRGLAGIYDERVCVRIRTGLGSAGDPAWETIEWLAGLLIDRSQGAGVARKWLDTRAGDVKEEVAAAFSLPTKDAATNALESIRQLRRDRVKLFRIWPDLPADLTESETIQAARLRFVRVAAGIARSDATGGSAGFVEPYCHACAEAVAGDLLKRQEVQTEARACLGAWVEKALDRFPQDPIHVADAAVAELATAPQSDVPDDLDVAIALARAVVTRLEAMPRGDHATIHALRERPALMGGVQRAGVECRLARVERVWQVFGQGTPTSGRAGPEAPSCDHGGSDEASCRAGILRALVGAAPPPPSAPTEYQSRALQEACLAAVAPAQSKDIGPAPATPASPGEDVDVCCHGRVLEILTRRDRRRERYGDVWRVFQAAAGCAYCRQHVVWDMPAVVEAALCTIPIAALREEAQERFQSYGPMLSTWAGDDPTRCRSAGLCIDAVAKLPFALAVAELSNGKDFSDRPPWMSVTPATSMHPFPRWLENDGAVEVAIASGACEVTMRLEEDVPMDPAQRRTSVKDAMARGLASIIARRLGSSASEDLEAEATTLLRNHLEPLGYQCVGGEKRTSVKARERFGAGPPGKEPWPKTKGEGWDLTVWVY